MKAKDFYIQVAKGHDGKRIAKLLSFQEEIGTPIAHAALEIEELRELASFIIESLDKYEASIKKG
jgi:hypothetical protein